jgi:protein-disulfide isomerase
VLGSASAPVRMVVFSSFQCPACKSFVELMRDVRRRYPDQVSIVFKHFPLGRECNPILKREMQPRACAAAFAAEAALQQNVFWQYHDRLFASSLLASEQILTDAAKETGIDLAKWESDRRSPAVKLKVASDVSLGTALGVEATPAVFINGKRLTYLSRRMVGLVISRELSRFASSGETARR